MRLLKVLFLVSIVLSIAINFLFLWQSERNKTAQAGLSEFYKLQQQYPLVAKRVLQEHTSDILLNFLPLRRDLRELVKPYGNSFAFYFEYLPTGTSIGVNENNEFPSASLFKVPVVMAYYHQKERLGLTDAPVVTIDPKNIDYDFGSDWNKKVGSSVSLDEAANDALVSSDNTAAKVLAGYIDQKDFDAVYNGIDINLQIEEGSAIITTKQYASILKALYYSSVISKDSSQHILDLLTKTKFADKLPAGVPQGIPVAHKIGILGNDVYMDCGIIYFQQRNFLLCMMSVSDENTARERMIAVSKKTYEYVSSIENKLTK